jgi:hypothetical protein
LFFIASLVRWYEGQLSFPHPSCQWLDIHSTPSIEMVFSRTTGL